MWINLVLLALLVVIAIGVARLRSLFAGVMLFGMYSLVSASLFVVLDAVDVAFTEAAVGAGIATILMLATLTRTNARQESLPSNIVLPLLLVFALGGLLIYGTLDMPLFGDVQAPAFSHVFDHYMLASGREIDVPNIVTSILASYRGYDTLGEVVVVFTAGVAVYALLQSQPDKP
ncbi:MAG: DUF4040 domain-containing protein [Arenicellales bacterium WSBS_2016_MAG_OTU3]